MTREEIMRGLRDHIDHAKILIDYFGENRSLGNVLQNLESKLKYWEEHK